MELEEEVDVLMGDEAVLASTESNGHILQPLDGSVDKGLANSSAWSALANGEASPTRKAPYSRSPVKALKQEDVFDALLTGRKDLPRPAKFKTLPYATLQTGLVYDVRMRFHVEVKPSEIDVHPEDPRRIHAIFDAFVQAGLAWETGAPPPSIDYYMGRVDARMVKREEVCLVHTQAHYEWVEHLRNLDSDALEEELQHPGEQTQLDSVYLSSQTPYCAALSAGGAIEACRAVMLGRVKNVFAVIRPPGHHAEREDVKGFCFYDNVSIATKVCQREFGESCRKVMILDWDVHHGNGIQQANYSDPNVLYVSLHVHINGKFYPEQSYRDRRPPYGDHLHCGQGAGMGKNVNIPWRQTGMGDAEYIYAFQQIVMPIAIEFDPDLVIIAAGFDAAEGDMLGGCHVTPAGYGHMTHMLMSLAKGRLAVCLEGGYNLDSIARSSRAVARVLMGEPPDRLENIEPSNSGVDDVKKVLRQQSKFWKCLYPKDLHSRLEGPLRGDRMHDIVRQWQATELWNRHQMMPLFVHHEKLSKSFDNQVLATPNYTEACPLLVILHNAPEMLAEADPRTGRIELHNTYLADDIKTYVDWAVKQGFAVIDVNLPKHITQDEDGPDDEDESTIAQTATAEHVMSYLWDNYIELNEASHIFLMSTNFGYTGIVDFIKANEEHCSERITKVISFVADANLQSCRSSTNDYLAPWYFANSMIFLAAAHHFWTLELATKKPKKKFGKVFRSSKNIVSEILQEHKHEVMEMMLEETEEWRMGRGTISEEDMVDVEDVALPEPKKLPQIGNFALSPAPRSDGNRAPERSTRTPRASSPLKSPLPPVGNFALSPRARPERSPARR